VPLVLGLVVLLTIVAVAALTVAAVERRTVTSANLQSDAYTIARTGLDRFVATRQQLGFTSVPPAVVESARVQLAEGYADVVLRRLRAAQGIEPALYVITSRGARTDRSSPPSPVAWRTVAQYARWQDPGWQVLAAWTSLGGIGWRTAGGALSGFDACGAATDVAGTAVPSPPGYGQGRGGSVPNGSPAIRNLGSAALAPDSVLVDWGRLRAGGLVPGEIGIPGSPWPSGTAWNDPNFWPIIVVTGNFVLPSSGRGFLVVTGDLDMPSGRSWDGVILVGGRVDERSGSRLDGAMVSGLNRKLGAPLTFPDSARGAPRITYHSCNIRRALAPFSGLAVFRNAIADNVP
jgi:hypothetical protein